MSSLSVIIITYNSERTIEDCLISVKKNQFPGLDLSFVLIDNNSKDSSAKIIGDHEATGTTVLLNSANLGFAKAVNQGLRVAQKNFDPDFFFLLNPDAALEEDVLKKIADFHQKKNGLLLSSPSIIDPAKKEPWFAGGKINWFSQKTLHTSPKNTEAPYQTEYLSGCALCIPKEVLKKTGEFDEQFFLYYEDADFSLRAKKVGAEIFVVPATRAYHTESQSSDNETKCYYLVKNGLLFFHKHYPFWAKPYFWKMFLLRYAYHKTISKKPCVLRGMKDFFATCWNKVS